MSKKGYLLSVLVLSSFIILMIYTTPHTREVVHGTTYSYENKPKELPIAKLKIDKIYLDNDIYNFKSSENTVEKNVMILDGSVLPNQNNNSIVFLAAHSGSGEIAYFNDLDKLVYNDEIIFNYNNTNYIYKVIKILEQEKDGDIEINRISSEQLVLTTCSKHKNKQLIVIASLKKKEKI